MNVLIIGSGGREHAMAYATAKSPHLDQLYIAPGNPGTAEYGDNVDLNTDDFEAVASFVEENEVHLTVIGPEAPLVKGLTDYLEKKGHNVFGPSKEASQLEGSKAFAKKFMQDQKIPTAQYVQFDRENFDKARHYLKNESNYPVVLKADGLAGGKGVFICQNQQEAVERLEFLKTDEKMKKAAATLVIEEFMKGEEASVFVISDGKSAKILANAQDHKRIGEGDTGLNTGGMGAYSPAPVVSKKLLQDIEKKIIMPSISGMVERGTPYKGVLYLGLMITEQGPKVVEYNCRMGDPECQAILPRVKSDWLEVMHRAATEDLDEMEMEIADEYYCCVVLASKGYPLEYEKGKVISGLDAVDDEALVFHSGTKEENGQILSDGGRVLNVVHKGNTLKEAIEATYAEVEKIHFENSYFRRDIGHKGLKRES